MRTSTRRIASKLWQDELPAQNRRQLVRQLYDAENAGAAAPSGSQDMIGLIYPGINRLDYDHEHAGGLYPLHIESNRDPAVAHWQDALESTFAALEPDLVPGQLNTTDDLEPDEIDRFRRLHATLDLAPYITALFLPRRISGRIAPPPAIKSIQRVPEAGVSNKILVSRHRDYRRLLVAETGPPPVRPNCGPQKDWGLGMRPWRLPTIKSIQPDDWKRKAFFFDWKWIENSCGKRVTDRRGSERALRK